MSGDKKKYYVHRMFNEIAGKYDFLNHFLSFGIDFYWRYRAIRLMKLQEGNRVMDLASGTGDLAIAALKRQKVKILAVDIAINMLRRAKEKIEKKGFASQISFICADGENLPFKNDVFDRAMIAFGIRNMGNPDLALSEIYRTLKPEGIVMILEFSLPTNSFFKKLYMGYFKLALPVLGRLISGHPDAYSYLPDSVEKFPPKMVFKEKMTNAGFGDVQIINFTFGICSVYIGNKFNNIKNS